MHAFDVMFFLAYAMENLFLITIEMVYFKLLNTLDKVFILMSYLVLEHNISKYIP